MKTFVDRTIIFIIIMIASAAFAFSNQKDINTFTISSPNNMHKAVIYTENHTLFYTVLCENDTLLRPSKLGIRFQDADFTLVSIHSAEKSSIDRTYRMLSGKRMENRDHANVLNIVLQNDDNKNLHIEFRAYDDGIAFRYAFNKDHATIAKDEATEFHVNPNGFAWMQRYDWWSPAYEKVFDDKIRIGAPSPQHREDGWAFPALFNIADKWMLITESNLDDYYCATHIRNVDESPIYKIEFAIKEEGYQGGILYPKIPRDWQSPWRVIMLGSLADIFQSNLVHHVADERAIDKTDWIKPGRASWSWLYEPDSPKDCNALKKYIDLSAKMGWEYSLVDANWNMMQNGDIHDLINYAASKNVGLFLWYNSGGPHNTVTEQPRNRLNDTTTRRAEFAKLQEWGIKGIKVDFFNSDKQDIIQLYLDILRDAAEYEIMVNFHGCTIPHGWQRTWPNLVATEAVKGGEWFLGEKEFPYIAGRHNAILPFTRNVIGSMDYTPVTFSPNKMPHVSSYAHELALSVVFESALFHFGDRAESYLSLSENVKGFLAAVPTVWDDSKLLSGYPGKTCVVARRSGDNWYIAGINGYFFDDELTVDMSFLGDEKHTFKLIKDGADKESFAFETVEYPAVQQLSIKTFAEGGFVMVSTRN